jgi:DNA repair protein RecN (Recombination protein N)
MSLRRIVLRDFVIVPSLDLELDQGFNVLTGETGAGKSILIDALQLALGARADSGVVREGATRCEIAAEFDAPVSLKPWLDEQGFPGDDGTLLLRRTVDTEGRSRGWINGGAATMTQLKVLADHLVDIHGQHAWQSLTRPDAVRGLLDAYAGLDTEAAATLWATWRQRRKALDNATERQNSLRQESERLAWQIGELDKLQPLAGEWEELNAQHSRLANAQGLLDAARDAAASLDDDGSAAALIHRALAALQAQAHLEPAFAEPIDALQAALAQVEDTVHSLHHYARHTDLDPSGLEALDQRLSQWISLARRYRRPPEELSELLAGWKKELEGIDQAMDLEALKATERQSWTAFEAEIKRLGKQRQQAAPKLSKAVTEAMQTLGMQGGRFDVALQKLDAPQAHGWELVEFLVAGHAGVGPKPVGKVASGGELSRIALAISVVTSRLGQAPTLIFDEVDSGIGGAVAHTVGQLLRQLGQDRQVLAVTHLPQVAACGDHHLLVSKRQSGSTTHSTVAPIDHEDRVRELARMLGGNDRSEVSLAHARELLTA